MRWKVVLVFLQLTRDRDVPNLMELMLENGTLLELYLDYLFDGFVCSSGLDFWIFIFIHVV